MDVSLQLGWQRAGEVDARCEKRCDRGDADLGLATPEERHDAIRGVSGESVLELRLHLLADTQALQHAMEMHPRRAILRVGDGFRVEQRALERLAGCDVGLRRAGAHRHTDPRAGDVAARRSDELAGLEQIVDCVACGDRHVECRALLDLALHGRSPGVPDGNLVAARTLELRDELLEGRPDPAGADYLDLGGAQDRYVRQQNRCCEGKRTSVHGSSRIDQPRVPYAYRRSNASLTP